MAQIFSIKIDFKSSSESKRAKLMNRVFTQTGSDPAYESLNEKRAVFKAAYDEYTSAAGNVTGKSGPTVDLKNIKLKTATDALETFGKEIEELAIKQNDATLLTRLGFATTKMQSTRHDRVDLGEGTFLVVERQDVSGSVRLVCACTNTEGLRGFKIRYKAEGDENWTDGGVSQGTRAYLKGLEIGKKYYFACQPFGTWGREGMWTLTPIALWVV